MRFAIDMKVIGTAPFVIPVNYRSDIIILLKKLIKCCDNNFTKYDEYWGSINTHRAKPYTFFLDVPDSHFVHTCGGGFYRLNSNSLKLFISSSDSEFFSLIYNGFLKMKDNFTIFGYPVELNEFYLTKLNSIDSNYARFKILSPIIVRDITIINGSKKNFRGYLSCNNPYFNQALAYSIITLCRSFLGDKYDRIKKDVKIDTFGCRHISLKHYREIIPGTKGVIGIKAEKDILKLIYDIGLGARRSQGFGMVDLGKKYYSKNISEYIELPAEAKSEVHNLSY